jgi:hypothetical protein
MTPSDELIKVVRKELVKLGVKVKTLSEDCISVIGGELSYNFGGSRHYETNEYQYTLRTEETSYWEYINLDDPEFDPMDIVWFLYLISIIRDDNKNIVNDSIFEIRIATGLSTCAICRKKIEIGNKTIKLDINSRASPFFHPKCMVYLGNLAKKKIGEANGHK